MRFRTAATSLLALLFATPVVTAQSRLERVERSVQARKGWLGISLEGDDGRPPQVVEVVPGSPAARGGLRVGDVVLKLDGKEAGDIDGFIERVQRFRSGRRIRLVVRRGDRNRELACILGVHPEARGAQREGRESRERRDGGAQAKRAERPAAKRGFLGVSVNEELEITNVIENTAASRAGLEKGDRVLSVGGERVRGYEEFVRRVQATGAGKTLKLRVRRGRAEREFRAKLGTSPSGTPAQPSGARAERPDRDAGMDKLEAEIKKLEAEIKKLGQPGKSAPKGKRAGVSKKSAAKKWNAKKSPPKKGVAWVTSLDRAKQLARRSGKPVVVDFYADWCKPCKMLEESFASGNVQRILARAVPVRVDVDKNGALADKYGVSTIPHVVVLDSRGKKLGEFTGYHPANVLAERLGKWVGAKSGGAKPSGRGDRPASRSARNATARRNATRRNTAKRNTTKRNPTRRRTATRAKSDAPARRNTAQNAELRRALRDVARSQAELNKRLERLMRLLEQADKKK